MLKKGWETSFNNLTNKNLVVRVQYDNKRQNMDTDAGSPKNGCYGLLYDVPVVRQVKDLWSLVCGTFSLFVGFASRRVLRWTYEVLLMVG